MHQTTYNSNRSRGIRGSHTDQPVYQIDPNTDSQESNDDLDVNRRSFTTSHRPSTHAPGLSSEQNGSFPRLRLNDDFQQWFRKAEVDSYHGLSSTAKIEAIESCMDNDVLKMYNPYRYVSPNFMQRTNYELFKESLEELKMLTVVAVADTILPLVKEPLESSETVLNAWSKMVSASNESSESRVEKKSLHRLILLHRLPLEIRNDLRTYVNMDLDRFLKRAEDLWEKHRVSEERTAQAEPRPETADSPPTPPPIQEEAGQDYPGQTDAPMNSEPSTAIGSPLTSLTPNCST